MPKVKVWNRNVPGAHWEDKYRKQYPKGCELKELFKGNEVKIPPGDFIEMEFYEAHEFKGQYHPQQIDNDGKLVNDPNGFKMIEIEPILAAKAEAPELKKNTCMKCKHESPSPEELEAHMKVRHADAEIVDNPDLKPSRTAPPISKDTRASGRSSGAYTT